MAENVHHNLEAMLPELEEMERLGIFTRQEIRSIIKKRTDLEYRLQKRIVKKPDFLQYMQYEINLDMLRKKRKVRLGVKKTATSDFAMNRRLNLLFQKALKKFVGDKKLWLQYIEFCRTQGSTKILGKVYAQLLQYHPHNPNFWVMAAKWEFEESKNVLTARTLLQRGIRMNPESTLLWLEYFRMELLHVDKVVKRRKVLGLAKMDEGDDEPVTDEFMAGKVAEIVYQKAIEAIPDDIGFRISFLNIYRLFEKTTQSQDKVYESLRRDFPNSEECWDVLACRPVEILRSQASIANSLVTESQWTEADEAMFKVYEEAVQVVPTEKMWDMFIQRSLQDLEGNSQSKADKIVSRTLEICKRADKNQLLSDEMYQTWASLHLMTGSLSQALAVYKQAVIKHAQSSQLWKDYLRLRIVRKESKETLEKAFWKALESVKSSDSLCLLELFIDWAVTCELDNTESIFEKSVESSNAVALVMKEHFIDWTAMAKGINKGRKLYKRLLSSMPVNLALFNRCITLEQSQLSPSIKHLRILFDIMIDRFGTTQSDCWLDYIHLELTHPDGAPENAGKLHRRAMRTLTGEETGNFVTKYSLLQAGNLG